MIRKNETAAECFFIVRGICEVMIDVDTEPVATFRRGQHFGEMALYRSMDQNAKRTAWVRATTYAHLARLDRCSFEDVLFEYPAAAGPLYAQLGEFITERYAEQAPEVSEQAKDMVEQVQDLVEANAFSGLEAPVGFRQSVERDHSPRKSVHVSGRRESRPVLESRLDAARHTIAGDKGSLLNLQGPLGAARANRLSQARLSLGSIPGFGGATPQAGGLVRSQTTPLMESLFELHQVDTSSEDESHETPDTQRSAVADTPMSQGSKRTVSHSQGKSPGLDGKSPTTPTTPDARFSARDSGFSMYGQSPAATAAEEAYLEAFVARLDARLEDRFNQLKRELEDEIAQAE